MNIVNIMRMDGSSFRIADIVCGDETGISNLRIKGDVISELDIGDVIAIRNGRIMIVKGHVRLEIDRWGKITPEVTNI